MTPGTIHEVPKVTFRVSRLMNEFCHISVLYPEFLHPELSNGMLSNSEYRRQNARGSQHEFAGKPGNTELISPKLWYSFARALMKSDSLENSRSYQGTFSKRLEMLLNFLDNDKSEYDKIWKDLSPRLEEYTRKFGAEWSVIGERVLSKLSGLVNQNWDAEEIVVCFVGCLNGGFAWDDSIALTQVPETDVAKKLLSHELSELMTPQYVIAQRLKRAGLEDKLNTIHTVVDLLAYFSVKDFLNNPERKGMKPNASYYSSVETLYPLFEAYSTGPEKFGGFDELLQNVILKLKEP